MMQDPVPPPTEELKEKQELTFKREPKPLTPEEKEQQRKIREAVEKARKGGDKEALAEIRRELLAAKEAGVLQTSDATDTYLSPPKPLSESKEKD